MGKLSRTSGHDFERLIVRKFKAWFSDRPWAEKVRRANQGHQAHASDVTGVPGIWVECQTAQDPTPETKLHQAERDVERLQVDIPLVPVAVTRKKGSTNIRATLRLSDLINLSFGTDLQATDPEVTLSLESFLTILRDAMPALEVESGTCARLPPARRKKRRSREETDQKLEAIQALEQPGKTTEG